MAMSSKRPVAVGGVSTTVTWKRTETLPSELLATTSTDVTPIATPVTVSTDPSIAMVAVDESATEAPNSSAEPVKRSASSKVTASPTISVRSSRGPGNFSGHIPNGHQELIADVAYAIGHSDGYRCDPRY